MVEHVVLGHVDAAAAQFSLATFPQDVVFERFVEHVDVSQFSPETHGSCSLLALIPLVTWHRGSSTGQSLEMLRRSASSPGPLIATDVQHTAEVNRILNMVAEDALDVSSNRYWYMPLRKT